MGWFDFAGDTTALTIQIVDVVVVAYLVYRLLLMVRGSRAWRILGGIAIYLILWYVSSVLNLRTLHFILDKALVLGPLALVILLLPEFRIALEGMGRLGFWPDRLGGGEETTGAMTVEEIVAAVTELSSTKTGALMIIERSRKLPEIERNGVMMEARVTSPLLLSVFHGTGPLHDGAVVIRGTKIVAAACHLPLSESRLRPHLHLRHRAAVGITEVSDAIAIVVSEERGLVSVALDGNLTETVDPPQLRDMLNQLLRDGSKPKRIFRSRVRSENEGVA